MKVRRTQTLVGEAAYTYVYIMGKLVQDPAAPRCHPSCSPSVPPFLIIYNTHGSVYKKTFLCVILDSHNLVFYYCRLCFNRVPYSFSQVRLVRERICQTAI